MHNTHAMDTPELAVLRQEWFSWHQRRFAMSFRKYWHSIQETDKLSKTLYSCKKDGLLIGLQAMHNRFVSGQMINSREGGDALFVHSDYIDNDILNELEVETGFPSNIAEDIFNQLVKDFLIAEFSLSEAKKSEPIKGKLVLLEKSTQIYHVVYEPDKSLITKLQSIRQDSPWKDSVRNTIQSIPLYRESAMRPFTSVLVINKTHYTKLQTLYTGNPADFLACLYCMLARYEIYSAGATGFQGSLTPEVFGALNTLFGVQGECFASPLNAYFPSYYSAFPDIDKFFGSLGSFQQDFKPSKGAWEINPPFVNSVMFQMTLLLNNLLEQPDADLFFFIIIPSWTDSPSYENLIHSKYLRYTWQLMRKKHSYIDGMQHRVQDKLTWSANVESSCFILCNKEVSLDSVNKLKLAFK